MLITKGKSLRKWSQNGPDLVQTTRSRKPPPLFHRILVRREGVLDRYVLILIRPAAIDFLFRVRLSTFCGDLKKKGKVSKR